MDWQAIVAKLTVGRLNKLARNAGLLKLGRKRKAQLVEALGEVLDEHLKREALLLFTGAELRALCQPLGLTDARRSKRDLMRWLLNQDRLEGSADDSADAIWELGDDDELIADRGRLDVPPGLLAAAAVEPLPSRPGPADLLLFFEVQELLRRPALHRAILATPSCDSALLQRLLGEGLDDLIESAVRLGPERAGDRPTISVILSDKESLGGDAGQALVSLAQQLAGRLEIRLLSDSRLLSSSLLAFEELLPGGPTLTALVGAPPPSLAMTRDERSEVATHIRLDAPSDAAETPTSVVKEWLRHLLRQSRPINRNKLMAMPAQRWVVDKVAYKLHLDTAHELRLKHIAEQLCRRGRERMPLFEPTAVEPLPRHQRMHLLSAAEPWRRGVMLCDDSGVGKTVSAAFIIARELRRRRVLASAKDTLARRALVVAPASLHRDWQEEFSGKLGLPCTLIPTVVAAGELSDPSQGRSVTICAPATVVEHWEALQGFDLLVVDEAHLVEETAMAALSGIAQAAQFCLVASGHPAQHDVADLLPLAALIEPAERWDTLTELVDQRDHFAQELATLATRTLRAPLLAEGTLKRRQLLDRSVALEPLQAEAYRALRQLRFDYQRRSNRDGGWAFVALERAFLSSLATFRSAVSWVLDTQRTAGAQHEVFGVERDDSMSFLSSSSYFKRRLAQIDEKVAPLLASDAVIQGKEAALLDVLRQYPGRAVVVFCGYRGTQQRLASVLHNAQSLERVDILDASSSLGERMAVIAAFCAALAVRRQSDGPAGVLLCTDEAAVRLSLQHCAFIGVNYDIPHNPQRLERRIQRLQRWGQTQAITMVNLSQRDPEPGGWTMDTRVLYCCRELFGMADPNGGIRDCLIELDPADLEAQLTGSDNGEFSLFEEPDPAVADEMEQLFALAKPQPNEAQLAELAQQEERYRQLLRDFWARVSYGASPLEGAPWPLVWAVAIGFVAGASWGVVRAWAQGRTVLYVSFGHRFAPYGGSGV